MPLLKIGYRKTLASILLAFSWSRWLPLTEATTMLGAALQRDPYVKELRNASGQQQREMKSPVQTPTGMESCQLHE